MRVLLGRKLRCTFLYLWRILVVGLVNALILVMLCGAPV